VVALFTNAAALLTVEHTAMTISPSAAACTGCSILE
jgi:hypothetical protein